MLRVFSLGPKAATSLPVIAIARPNEPLVRYKSLLQQAKRTDHTVHTTRPKGKAVKEQPNQLQPAVGTRRKIKEEVEIEGDASELAAVTESWDIVTENLFSYPTGRPWKLPPIRKTLPTHAFRSLEEGNRCESSETQLNHSQDPPLRSSSLRTIRTTQDTEIAWEAYRTLLQLPLPTNEHKPIIPYAYLHRLSRLFARARPKTRTNFLRHVSVLLTLHKSGGQVHLHEWNAILHSVGKGWRKGNKEDYLNSLGIFLDMVEGRSPAATFLGGMPPLDLPPIPLPSLSASPSSNSPSSDDRTLPSNVGKNNNPKPDIFSYTTLLSAASRSHDHSSFLHAVKHFQASGLRPSRITHLSMLRYYTNAQNQKGVKSVLGEMMKHRHSLGIDGMNAALWAYIRCEVIKPLPIAYRLMRHSIRNLSRPNVNLQESLESGGWYERHRLSLKTDYNMVVEPHLVPNQVTFCMVSQVLAHHGDLTGALTVFTDMLLASNREVGAPVKYPKDGKLSADLAASRFRTYEPPMVMFRGLFLGFARHGTPDEPLGKPAFNPFLSRMSTDFFTPSTPRSILYPALKAAKWNLENLQCLFEQFTSISWNRTGEKMTPGVWYWIMLAFGRTSNYDLTLLREAWVVLEREFGPARTGANGRLFRLRRMLFNDDV
jgi:hypothetical protein